MRTFTFHLPTRILFGKSRIKELSVSLDKRYDRILLVTDSVVEEKSGAVDKVCEQLQGRAVERFTGVEENPSFQVIENGAVVARECDAQLVVGIGGGSPMDAAKGISVLTTDDGDMRDFMRGKPLGIDPLPVVCIPTTSGTGSEVTPYAVFTDHEAGTKGGFSHPKIFPVLSVVDPELTYSMPPSVVVNTGLDVLTHSIEAYLSTESFPLNDVVAVESIGSVLQHLPDAAAKKETAMDRMAYASMLGGVAITHGGTILLHIMGYPLTIHHAIPHGLANAILLPAFLRFMKEHSTVKDRVRYLEELFAKVGGIEPFINSLGVSTNLSSYGIGEEEIPTFADEVIVKGDVKITPAVITDEIIAGIYRAAMET